MRTLVTGANGQLGKALQGILKKNTLFTDVREMDITDFKKTEKVILKFKPQVIIHTAAYTDVDGCEENRDLAIKINTKGTFNLAVLAKRVDAILVYISTDYVFDGNKKAPYTEKDLIHPLSFYGQTKYLGEVACKAALKHYIIRTSWVFGDGKNFIKTMLKLGESKKEIKVVSDQVGRPTYTEELANGIIDILKKKPEYGIYNLTCNGNPCSWAVFAKEIFKLSNKEIMVKPLSTKEYFSLNRGKKIAPRPKNSVLNLDKINKQGIKPKNWVISLKEYLKKGDLC